MSQEMLVCTVCARGGSKGVPGKNKRVLAGKPLIVHTLEQAMASGLFHSIAVSSDDPDLLRIATEVGVLAIKRPDQLATDQAAKLPAIRHAVAEVERVQGVSFDIMVDLDATSPLRRVDDIVSSVALLRSTGASNVITASPARHSPYFNQVEERPDGTVGLSKPPLEPIVRRQDAPPVYDMNGSVYVWRADVLRQDGPLFLPDTRLHIMPPERSVDIDSEIDWKLVENLMMEQS